jgi:hypothetical protein
MKIFIICSKRFYRNIPEIQKILEEVGHDVVLPNSYDKPGEEERRRALSSLDHATWKAEMIRLSEKKIQGIDAVLVLNFEKDGVENYIGGATFIEMYDAFRLGKKIFIYNDIPKGILHDEIIGFMPIVINKDLSKVQ